MPRFIAASFLFLAGGSIGCIDDSSSIPTTIVPNLVTADPTTFLGATQCGPEVRSYVVTLYDVTRGARVPVATSPPTTCTRQTSFGSSVIAYGHAYVADIDGYDRDDLVPDTSPNAEPRNLVDPVTLQRVAMRWTTTCGERPGPSDAGPDGSDSPDGSPDAGEIPSSTAGSIGSDAPIDLDRFPTVVLSSGEVVLHPCYPLQAVATASPQTDGGSPADRADPTDDGREATFADRIEPDASEDAGAAD
jgi:hypothetical protein